MACGYGACYGCSVEIDGVLQRLCVAGPGPGGRVILNASGCLDALEAPEVARALDVFVTKTVTPQPREGNRPGPDRRDRGGHAQLDRAREPRASTACSRTSFRAWPSSESRSGCPSAASRRTTTPQLCAALDDRREVTAIELNLSCPNVEEAPESAAELVAAARPQTGKPLYAKLSPAATDLPETARAVQNAGADGLSLVNTIRGLALDDQDAPARPRARARRLLRTGPEADRARRRLPVLPRDGTADRGHGRDRNRPRRARLSRRRSELDRARNGPVRRPGSTRPSAPRAGGRASCTRALEAEDATGLAHGVRPASVA